MAISIPGTLGVRHISSKRGVFSVGELSTEVGRFKVKDPILDQYEEGEYRGTFLISQIFPSSYVWGGRVITEVRANLVEIFLDEAEEKPMPPPAPEPDETEEGGGDQQGIPAPAPEKSPLPTPTSAVSAAGSDEDPDATLFGELYAQVKARQEIKLDPTIDRQMFRQQRDRLKELGFKFESTTQSWKPRD